MCERKGIGEGKGGWGKMGEAFIFLSREARGGHALSYLERQWGAIISLIRSLHLFSLSRGVLSPHSGEAWGAIRSILIERQSAVIQSLI